MYYNYSLSWSTLLILVFNLPYFITQHIYLYTDVHT